MKKRKIILFLLLILSIISIYIVNNNYNFYKEKIIKISNVKNKLETVEKSPFGLEEKYYKQIITGKLLNTKDKNKTITVENTYTTSNVVTEKYSKNDIVFIKDNTIIGLKRDKYIIYAIIIFVIFISIIGNKVGLISLASLIINITIFTIGLTLYQKGINLILLIIFETVIFTIVSLLITNGYNKKTKSAIISSLISIFVLIGLIMLVKIITKYNGINFNGMSFLTTPPEDVFTAEIIIGGLGAIMDVAITLSSSFDELVKKNKKISCEALKESAKNISQDITSTMINVLFFTYLSSALPTLILALRNGFTLKNYITSNYSLELTRFLIGSIGITLTIIVSTYSCLYIYKKEAK